MPDNYICKECNYTSDSSGFCPYCDMPLEPLDPTKVDQTTGQPANYDEEELKEDIDEDEITFANAEVKKDNEDIDDDVEGEEESLGQNIDELSEEENI